MTLSVLVIYSCVTNCHKRSCLKQHRGRVTLTLLDLGFPIHEMGVVMPTAEYTSGINDTMLVKDLLQNQGYKKRVNELYCSAQQGLAQVSQPHQGLTC